MAGIDGDGDLAAEQLAEDVAAGGATHGDNAGEAGHGAFGDGDVGAMGDAGRCIAWVVDHAAFGGAGLKVLDDAGRQWGGSIGRVADDAGDGAGGGAAGMAEDFAPRAIGVEPDEQIPREEWNDGAAVGGASGQVQREVGLEPEHTEFAGGLVFAVGVCPGAEPTPMARQ